MKPPGEENNEMKGNERKMSPTTENGCQQLLLNTILTLLVFVVVFASPSLFSPKTKQNKTAVYVHSNDCVFHSLSFSFYLYQAYTCHVCTLYTLSAPSPPSAHSSSLLSTLLSSPQLFKKGCKRSSASSPHPPDRFGLQPAPCTSQPVSAVR